MLNRSKLAVLSILILISLSASGLTDKEPKKSKKPVNIIFFIGDGMGPAEVSAGIAVSDKTFVFESFPFSGFTKTSASDNYITDSAAAGTAMACGVKTRNGMIGTGPDSIAVESVMEIAKRNGLSTGLVSTSAITHATPASFVAHNSGRGNYEDIAKDFMNGTIDVFIGGGSDHFNKRADGTDLTAELKNKGYDVVYTIDQMNNSTSTKIAGLLAPGHMDKANGTRKGMLEQMTMKAIEALKTNKKGFILMVEGSQIDFAGHAKDIDWVISEVTDLNNAVAKAYDFAREDGNTLVIVTADHETGGLTLPGGDIQKHTIVANFGSAGHTATMVPVFSYGPGASDFSGIHENTFFFNEFVNLLRLSRKPF
jgi:alkaline phosphatase